MAMRLELDHLVVAAASLAEGVAWCEQRLGIAPTAGGQHVFMGTHNRVFNVSSPAFVRSYLEIIAVDPALPAPAQARWFDLDDAAMRQRLKRGPQLVHWVARCADIAAARGAMLAAGVDCGDPMQAERGTLRWRITLRADGRRPLAGAGPALIQWGDAHPTDSLPPSGVRLDAFTVAAPTLTSLLPGDVSGAGSVPLTAVLTTPCGVVTLSSGAA
ncbi:MAG: VOC family protein [Burkholderiales bacterium]